MLKDYEIRKCDLIKGYRWLVFKRINKNVAMMVTGGYTKKECEEWIKQKKSGKKNKHSNKQRNV